MRFSPKLYMVHLQFEFTPVNGIFGTDSDIFPLIQSMRGNRLDNVTK